MTEEKQTPGQPTPLTLEISDPIGVKDFRNLYILYYLRGGLHASQQKHFFHSGTFREVIDRGKRHCDTMSYRFISVKPFISDLSLDEKQNEER